MRVSKWGNSLAIRLPAAVIQAMTKVQQYSFVCAPSVTQYAALACFDERTIEIVEQRRAELDQRRRYLIPALESLGFKIPVIPQGAFYIYADSSPLAADSFVLARRILTEGLSVRQTEAIGEAGGRKRGAGGRKPRAKDADTRALEKSLSDLLGLAVSIEHRGGSGEVRIAYSSLEQLDDVCRRLRG